MIKEFVDKRKSREPWSTPYARKKYRKVINGESHIGKTRKVLTVRKTNIFLSYLSLVEL